MQALRCRQEQMLLLVGLDSFGNRRPAGVKMLGERLYWPADGMATTNTATSRPASAVSRT